MTRLDLSDLSDLFGLLVAVWLLGAVAFVAVRAMMLVLALHTRRWQHLGAVSLLSLLVLVYVLLYTSDIPGVLAILNNHEQDIPPLSIARSAVFDGILSLTGYLLRVLARGRIQ